MTLLTFSGHRELVTSAAFSGPAGSGVVTASADGTARVWDALFQPELEKVAQLPSRIESIDAEDGRLRVTTVDGRVSPRPRHGKLGVEERVLSDGLVRGRTAPPRRSGRTRSCFGPKDGGRCSRVIETVCGRWSSLRTGITSRRPAGITTSGSGDGTTGEGLRPLQHNSEVRDASFSPDGRWLVSAAFGAALWDPRSGVDRCPGCKGTKDQ